MHECNAHICSLYFVTSNPGILDRPIMDLRFSPEEKSALTK
jgi:hypothetical protein